MWNLTGFFDSGTGNYRLPLVSLGTYNFVVFWGDGSYDEITVYNQPEITHEYNTSGIYNIKIIGQISGWGSVNQFDSFKITSIDSLGDLDHINSGAFHLADNLVWNTDETIVIDSSDLQQTFNSNVGVQFNYDPFNQFDFSNVTNINRLVFSSNYNFNVSNWDVSMVENMQWCFGNCSFFNQDLSSWDFTSVNDMANFLSGATLSTVNYDLLLIRLDSFISDWITGGTIPFNFHGGNSQYTTGGAAETARNNLLSFGLTITDGGPAW